MTELSATAERLFSGQIGAEYDMLDVICPAAAAMSDRVGEFVAALPPGPLNVAELGCGTGVTTRALLRRSGALITALDNEPAMLSQASDRLADFIDEGRVRLVEADALAGLAALPSGETSVVASAYTIHNFLEPYRLRVLAEIFRVLKPGGIFVNGDRYALDETARHTRLTQDEARHYFKTFAALNRYDLLEQWIIHLFSDESADHIMRLGPSLDAMRALGFDPVEVLFRDGVNALVSARKPAA
ncbi:class I SAM-dependent methyltransferase [Methylocapsa palsarum]|uniref:Ubiquinone/menaquinone biosynthesis C-methylase UbiE n=1 Tax=Methylocapsa palsarum TaxID=1612308 RepID=A0A1I3W668_9HYPH|nr:L-histidine N(alpha)-methyltransferase [Methylocapsa palsarum]SFK02799.1 Ubiquinone/menaquinone biosynthesis C-methylase UbiE [Methylocapsa palsarum]